MLFSLLSAVSASSSTKKTPTEAGGRGHLTLGPQTELLMQGHEKDHLIVTNWHTGRQPSRPESDPSWSTSALTWVREVRKCRHGPAGAAGWTAPALAMVFLMGLHCNDEVTAICSLCLSSNYCTPLLPIISYMEFRRFPGDFQMPLSEDPLQMKSLKCFPGCPHFADRNVQGK